jgi:hypothetical protein
VADVLASKLTVEHAQDLLALERGELRTLAKTYEQARLAILAKLSQAKADTFTAQHYRVTLAQLQKAVAELTKQIDAQGQAAQIAALEQGAAQTLEEIAYWEAARGFQTGAHGRIQSDALRRIHQEVLLQRFQVSMETYGSELVGTMQRKLGMHLAMRSRWADMAADIAGDLQGAAIAGAQWKAERIVRTELVHALNAGHQAALEASEPRLPGLARQWDAHLDARTSHVCKGLNGQIRGIKQPWQWEGRDIMHPPALPNCRSRVIPWRKAWAELDPSIRVQDLPQPTREQIEAAEKKAARKKARRLDSKELEKQASTAEYLLKRVDDPAQPLNFRARWAGELLGLPRLSGIARRMDLDPGELKARMVSLIERNQAVEKSAAVLREALADWEKGERGIALLERLAKAGDLPDAEIVAARVGPKLKPAVEAAKADYAEIGQLAETLAIWKHQTGADFDTALDIIRANAQTPARLIAAAKHAGIGELGQLLQDVNEFAAEFVALKRSDYVKWVMANGTPAKGSPGAALHEEWRDRFVRFKTAANPAGDKIDAIGEFSVFESQPAYVEGLWRGFMESADGTVAEYLAAKRLGELTYDFGDDLRIAMPGVTDEAITATKGTAANLVKKVDSAGSELQAWVYADEAGKTPALARSLFQHGKQELEIAAELANFADPKAVVTALWKDLGGLFTKQLDNATGAWGLKFAKAGKEAAQELLAEISEAASDLAQFHGLKGKAYTEFIQKAYADAIASGVKVLKAEVDLHYGVLQKGFAEGNDHWVKVNAAALKKYHATHGDDALVGMLEPLTGSEAAAKQLLANLDDWAAGKIAPAAANVDEALAVVVKGDTPWPIEQSGAPQSVKLPDGKTAKKVAASSGSNPGGFYKTDDGAEWFIKFPKATGQVSAEVAAARLASKMGLKVKDYSAFAVGKNHVAIASPKVELKQIGQSGLQDVTAAAGNEMAAHFVHAAWTRNWDVVGLGFDNLVVDAAGELLVVDYGGSLLWRAQGALKPGGMPKVVDELKSLLDPSKNAQTAAVFGNLSEGQIAKAIQTRLAKVSDDEIAAIVKSAGFTADDQAKILTGLQERRQWLLEWAEQKLPKPKAAPGVPPAPKPKKLLSSPEEVHQALLGHLDKDARAAGIFKPGQFDEGNASSWKAALEGDAVRLAKMGRRLWAGTPSLQQNQDLALRLLYTAYQKNPSAVLSELANWDTMKELAEALPLLPKGLASVEDIHAQIAGAKARAEAIAAQKAIEAKAKLEAWKKAQTASKAEYQAALAKHQADVAAWKAEIERLTGGLPEKFTKTGALSTAYKKRARKWIEEIGKKRGLDGVVKARAKTILDNFDEAQRRVAQIKQEAADWAARATRPDVRPWQKRDIEREARRIEKRARELAKTSEKEFVEHAEAIARETGVLPTLPAKPSPPRPPGGAGIVRPIRFETTHVSSDVLRRAARESVEAIPERGVHGYLQGVYDPEKAWFTDLPEDPTRPFDPEAGFDAIRSFTGASSSSMRAAKLGREGYKNADGSITRTVRREQIPHYKQMADDLDELVARLPGYDASSTPHGYIQRRETFQTQKDRQLYLARLREWDAAGRPTLEDVWSAPASSSSSQGTWSGELEMRVFGKCSGTPVRSISSHASENEVLFASGSRFLVRDWRESGGNVIVELVEVFADGSTGLD